MVFSTILSVSTVAFAGDENWNYSRDEDDECANVPQVSQSVNDSGVFVQGDWSKPGSTANNNAKQMFSFLTGTYGLSGAAASGIIAAAIHESGLKADNYEKYAKHNRRQSAVTNGVAGSEGGFGMNNREPVKGMAQYDGGPGNGGHYGGGGLFQFTPFTKFTTSEYWGKFKPEGWSVENQLGFLITENFFTRSIEPYMSSSPRRYGRAVVHSTVEQFFKETNPRLAAQTFVTAYERPGSYYSRVEDTAVAVDKMFNTSNVGAEPNKWQFRASKSNFLSKLKNSLDGLKKNSKMLKCVKKRSSNIEGWEAGWGSHGLTLSEGGEGLSFFEDELPASLRPFVLNLKQAGLPNGSCTPSWLNWTNTASAFLNGQCVALSKAAFHAIWLKDGKPGPAFAENGGKMADAAAKAFGGQLSDKPSKGAVAQVQQCTANGCYGHTYIVSHVFANGDILIIEQNYRAGWARKRSCEYEYRLMSPKHLAKKPVQFFSPASLGYKPNPKVL